MASCEQLRYTSKLPPLPKDHHLNALIAMRYLCVRAIPATRLWNWQWMSLALTTKRGTPGRVRCLQRTHRTLYPITCNQKYPNPQFNVSQATWKHFTSSLKQTPPSSNPVGRWLWPSMTSSGNQATSHSMAPHYAPLQADFSLVLQTPMMTCR